MLSIFFVIVIILLIGCLLGGSSLYKSIDQQMRAIEKISLANWIKERELNGERNFIPALGNWLHRNHVLLHENFMMYMLLVSATGCFIIIAIGLFIATLIVL